MKQAFTHGGRFHADDVFSAALLTYLYPNIVIERGNQVPEHYDGIVFDIGFGAYDHHQEGKEVRDNGIPYAAFGLLWRRYGKTILEEEMAEKFEQEFVEPIDFSDNTGEKNAISEMISLFNPSWDEDKDEDIAFEEAKEVALKILKRRFQYLQGEKKAEKLVKNALEQMENHIIILERFAPWKNWVIGTDCYFVVYPSKRGGYNAQGVPKVKESRELHYNFPESWYGKSAEELKQISNIRTLEFCHNSGFLIATGTLEDAIKACEVAMKKD